MGETEPARLRAVEALRRQQQAPGLGGADALDHHWGNLGRGNTQLHFGQGERCAPRGHGHIRQAGEPQATGHGRALNPANPGRSSEAVIGLSAGLSIAALALGMMAARGVRTMQVKGWVGILGLVLALCLLSSASLRAAPGDGYSIEDCRSAQGGRVKGQVF